MIEEEEVCLATRDVILTCMKYLGFFMNHACEKDIFERTFQVVRKVQKYGKEIGWCDMLFWERGACVRRGLRMAKSMVFLMDGSLAK